MSTFVLVHGASHGGWYWDRVARPLRDVGHSVRAPTLTRRSERAHLLSPLAGPEGVDPSGRLGGHRADHWLVMRGAMSERITKVHSRYFVPASNTAAGIALFDNRVHQPA